MLLGITDIPLAYIMITNSFYLTISIMLSVVIITIRRLQYHSVTPLNSHPHPAAAPLNITL